MKRLLRDEGIVRNLLKIAAAIQNTKAFLTVRKEFGSFDAYLWSFVGGKPIQNRWRTMAKVPARTAESDAMSRDLLRRGFKFAGSTICYALMQATGMVNDHLVTCPRHVELGGKRSPVSDDRLPKRGSSDHLPSGISKSYARAIAAGWLQRIPSPQE